MELNPFPYKLRRSGRRRTIALAVDPTGAVRVLAPLFAPRFWIERVVKTHWSWVLRKQAQIAETRMLHPIHTYQSGDRFPVWGVPLELDIQPQVPLKKAHCQRIENSLCVYMPARPARKLPPVKDMLRAWFQKETERHIAAQIESRATQMGVRFSTFTVVYQKSRWGSCSRAGHLRFNALLALFPPAAVEYVIVHELAHIKEANHSARFWAVVHSALPDYKERRRLLRQANLKTLI